MPGKGKKKKGKKDRPQDDEDIEALLAELDGPPRPVTPPAEVSCCFVLDACS